MVGIKPIRTEEDYKAALARIEEIFEAEFDFPKSGVVKLSIEQWQNYQYKPGGFDINVMTGINTAFGQ